MAILRGPDNEISRSLSEAEKNLGVDLKLTTTGDLELTNLGDINLVVGGSNAAQAVKTKLLTEPGGVLYHPEIGTDLQIGSKTINAFTIQTQIIKSLSQDPRFEDVQAIVQVDGSTIFVNIIVKIVDTDIAVPLQFSVAR